MKFSELKEKNDLLRARPDDSSEKVKNLEVILDIVNRINKTLILEDVLELVLKSAMDITKSERGFIVLSNTSNKLEYKLGLDDNGGRLQEGLFEVSNSVVEDVFASGQSKFIEGAQSDTDYDPSKSILRLELQTILCSPLITDEKKIGVIYVDSKRLHKVKVKEITDTFEILAGQAATAIRNAQLYKSQINSFNALQEANTYIVEAERTALRSSIDSEIGQALQSLVYLALLETESLIRTIEKAQKEYSEDKNTVNSVIFDRIKLKSKVAGDSIRSIQKYAQVLLETTVKNLNKEGGDLNRTIQSVITYLSPMKKFSKVSFTTNFNTLAPCRYDSEQIQHLLVQLFTNSANAKSNAAIVIKTFNKDNNNYVIVEDDGPGFSEENKNAFFELRSKNKNSYGLFLCKNIIDRHKGGISILDTDKGAAVEFNLPVD